MYRPFAGLPRTVWTLALTTTLVCGAWADESAVFPSNEALRHFRDLTDPQVSPDGKEVLVRVADAAADGGKGHLWLIPVENGNPRQLTYSPATDKTGESSGQWTPDGLSVVFPAHRGEHSDLFILPMSGGEARALSVKLHPQVDESTSKDALPATKPDELAIATAGKWRVSLRVRPTDLKQS